MSEYSGTPGPDVITGTAGDDNIYGGDGADTLSGGDGADLIYSRAPGDYDIYDNAKDVLHGDAGDDTLVGGYGDDLDGGTGTDTFVLDLLYSSGGITADFGNLWNNGSLVVAGGTLQNLDRYQSVYLTSGNDVVAVGDIARALQPNAAIRVASDYGFGVFASDGNDVISASATNAGGKLFVDGGAGRDRLVADFSEVTYSIQTVGLSGTLASGFTGRFYAPGSGIGTAEPEPGIGFTGIEDLTVTGGSGNDLIRTGGGNDYLFGGAGDDYLDGGDGDDVFVGGPGHDQIYGGNGTDTVDFSHESAGIYVALYEDRGSSGNGTSSSDMLHSIENVVGTDYNDDIEAIITDGPNRIEAGAGDDWVYSRADGDYLDGGTGQDTLFYENAPRPVWVDLSLGVTLSGASFTAVGWSGPQSVSINFENVLATAGNDVVRGDSGANQLSGLSGNDLLSGFAGADFLIGGDGEDAADYSGETGGQGIHVDLGAQPAASAGTATDTYGDQDLLQGIEDIFGSQWDDVITGDAGANILGGDAGNDVLTGAGGADVLRGQAGADTFVYLDVSDSAPGQGDVITDFSNAEGDKVDLRAIDANANADGAQSFTFVPHFTGTAGELAITGGSGGEWHVVADVNGDGIADFDITVLATGSFSSADLLF